jgi:hypothetical protein
LRRSFRLSGISLRMPELARFYGIVVQVYYGDHLPPHFHAHYAGHSAKVDIESLALIEGDLPARAKGLVILERKLRVYS